MTVDKMFINDLRKRQRMLIPEDLEAFLLDQYGQGPFPYEYTEQDLYEQIRKLVKQYHMGELNTTVKNPMERLQMNYSCLQQEYADAMVTIKKLESEICVLKDVLRRNCIEAPDLDEEIPY